MKNLFTKKLSTKKLSTKKLSTKKLFTKKLFTKKLFTKTKYINKQTDKYDFSKIISSPQDSRRLNLRSPSNASNTNIDDSDIHADPNDAGVVMALSSIGSTSTFASMNETELSFMVVFGFVWHYTVCVVVHCMCV